MRRQTLLGAIVIFAVSLVAYAQVPATLRDFQVSGTHVGDVDPDAFLPPGNCASCHRIDEEEGAPSNSWAGSKRKEGKEGVTISPPLSTGRMPPVRHE